MRVKLTIQYDGTLYSGWQVQPKKVTVQKVIEDALKTLTGEELKITGSGRTDAGVHARSQVAHFDYNGTIPAKKFSAALNRYLPNDVRIISSEEASENFNARKSAKKKTYEYSFYVSENILPLKERFSVNLNKMPDIAKMRAAAAILIGEHDFKAFSSTGGGAKTSVRTIYELNVIEETDGLKIQVTGNGFLYNMVRIIAGALVAVGQGRIDNGDILSALDQGKREFLSKTLPAKGLCLKSVEYQ